jgi:multicomponent K+:H+ antiporter subunit D
MGCTLMLAGMPPLPGFLGKFAMPSALFNPLGLAASAGQRPGLAGWTFLIVLVASGFLALTALARAGIAHFGASQGRRPLRVGLAEGLPIGALLLVCVLLAVAAGPALQFTQAAADALHAPGGYVQAVLGAEPVPSAAAGSAPQAPGEATP